MSLASGYGHFRVKIVVSEKMVVSAAIALIKFMNID